MPAASEGTGLFLGIDLGTASTKAVFLDGNRREVSAGSAGHAVHSPARGWAESDPADWWQSVQCAVGDALHGANGSVDPAAVVGVGLSGQMHGAVLVDSGGNPVRPAVLWADERADGELDRYRELSPDRIEALGNPLVAGMTGPILCWLKEFESESYRRAAHVMQSKDWLRLHLTGHIGTEHSDASATLLYDLAGRCWADDVIADLGLRGDMMAPAHMSGDAAGGLTTEASQALGLPVGLPVAYGAGDVSAALAGTGLSVPGVLQLTVGTAAQIVTLRDAPQPDEARRYHVFVAATGGYYALAAVQAAGLAFEWAWKALATDWRSAYQALATSTPGANGVSFIPHVAGARSPSMEPHASGAFCGARLSNDRADLIRSVFEGVAFSILDAARTLPEYEVCSEMRLAGGGTLELPWRQLLADVLNRSLVVLPAANASARGAAILAARAAGHAFRSPEEEPEKGAVVEPSRVIAAELATAYERWSERSAALGGGDAY